MESLRFRTVVGGILIFLTIAAVPAVSGAMTPKLYRMQGRITAIDPAAHTVVVNVPLTEKTNFTVAGPLAKDAILRRGDKKAALSDFKVGEWVTVEWMPTSQGHLIKELELK